MQRQDLELLVAYLREGVIALDRNGCVCLCNPTAARLLGMDSLPQTGSTLEDAIPDPQTRMLVSMLRATQEPEAQRETTIDLGGEQRLLDITIQNLTPRTSPQIGQIVYLTDITELALSSRVKADFVANASHELRTPLSTMKAAIETLLESVDDLGGHTRRFVEVLSKNIDRLEALVQDLLDLNLVETGKFKVTSDRTSLKELTDQILRDYSSKIAQRGIEVKLDLRAATVRTDARLLRLILVNLFDNAVKFVPRREGCVRITSSLRADRVVVEVADNGMGIPPEDQQRIFERFYQVDKARTEYDEPGTGLGLAIVKHAAALLGAAVTLSSIPGAGTRVSLTLPDRP